MSIIWGHYVWRTHWNDAEGLSNWEMLLVFMIYGAVIAAIITGLIIFLWIILAKLKVTVHFAAALFSGAIIITYLFGGFHREISEIILQCTMGTLAGALFWLTAFGPYRRIAMNFE
ncbi:hypothetical protein [Halocynthiibacter sp.]|uniref:hypothetical protein n=1 Tax=Halocynthiibacter sp. TaxID=1979210 RepID=UPI003C610609